MSHADGDGHACAEAITCGIEIGATVGTVVEPGGGTAIGAGVGLVVGAVVDIGSAVILSTSISLRKRRSPNQVVQEGQLPVRNSHLKNVLRMLERIVSTAGA